MFDKLKQLAQLKKMQDGFKKEKLIVEKNGVFVTMNGSMDIEEVKLNPELSIEDQQRYLKDALNDAKQQIQRILAQKMMGSGFGL